MTIVASMCRIIDGEGHLVQKAKMRPIIRHETTPNPNGCRYCGQEKHSHANSWVPSVGGHNWVEPTNDQRKARMKALYKK